MGRYVVLLENHLTKILLEIVDQRYNMVLVLHSANTTVLLLLKERRTLGTTRKGPPKHPAVRLLSDQCPGLWILCIVDCQPLLPLVAVRCLGFIRKQNSFPVFRARPQGQLFVCEGTFSTGRAFPLRVTSMAGEVQDGEYAHLADKIRYNVNGLRSILQLSDDDSMSNYT